MSDNLDKLYEYYNQLDSAKDDIAKHEDSYKQILDAVKGSSNEKRLAAQFIPKFFSHFPNLHEQAIDSLIDLCEDEDVAIRRQAIRELPLVCRDHKEYVIKIADVLGQLLQTDDQTELIIVNQAMMTLSKFDTKSFLAGLFPQIANGDDMVRDRAIKFLKDKIRPAETFTKEIEEFFLQETRKVMSDVTKEEFIIFMNLLGSLKISKTISGQQTLLEIISEQAELEVGFDHSDIDFVDKLIMCIRHAIPFFSQFIPSTDFFSYVCKQVVPSLDHLKEIHPDIVLDFLKLLAEMSPYVASKEGDQWLAECQQIVFGKLLTYMPLPPPELTQDNDSEPSVDFTHIESLLYTFHQLGKQQPDFLADSQSDRVKDFRLRLQYLARGVQATINKIRKALTTIKNKDMDSEENKLRKIALKTTMNINMLIKDLFKSPPSYKTQLILSWKLPGQGKAVLSPVNLKAEKSETKSDDANGTQKPKRQLITAPEGSPAKKERQIYAPPGGKFSGGMKRFGGAGGGSGGGRFRGQRRGGFGRGFRRGRGVYSKTYN